MSLDDRCEGLGDRALVWFGSGHKFDVARHMLRAGPVRTFGDIRKPRPHRRSHLSGQLCDVKVKVSGGNFPVFGFPPRPRLAVDISGVPGGCQFSATLMQQRTSNIPPLVGGKAWIPQVTLRPFPVLTSGGGTARGLHREAHIRHHDHKVKECPIALTGFAPLHLIEVRSERLFHLGDRRNKASSRVRSAPAATRHETSMAPGPRAPRVPTEMSAILRAVFGWDPSRSRPNPIAFSLSFRHLRTMVAEP